MRRPILLVDWDWADSNPDDPCVRDAQGRSVEASVKLGSVDVTAPPSKSDALWALVNAAEWDEVCYLLADDVRSMVARTAEQHDAGYLLVVVRNERITGGFLR